MRFKLLRPIASTSSLSTLTMCIVRSLSNARDLSPGLMPRVFANYTAWVISTCFDAVRAVRHFFERYGRRRAGSSLLSPVSSGRLVPGQRFRANSGDRCRFKGFRAGYGLSPTAFCPLPDVAVDDLRQKRSGRSKCRWKKFLRLAIQRALEIRQKKRDERASNGRRS